MSMALCEHCKGAGGREREVGGVAAGALYLHSTPHEDKQPRPGERPDAWYPERGSPRQCNAREAAPVRACGRCGASKLGGPAVSAEHSIRVELPVFAKPPVSAELPEAAAEAPAPVKDAAPVAPPPALAAAAPPHAWLTMPGDRTGCRVHGVSGWSVRSLSPAADAAAAIAATDARLHTLAQPAVSHAYLPGFPAPGVSAPGAEGGALAAREPMQRRAEGTAAAEEPLMRQRIESAVAAEREHMQRRAEGALAAERGPMQRRAEGAAAAGNKAVRPAMESAAAAEEDSAWQRSERAAADEVDPKRQRMESAAAAEEEPLPQRARQCAAGTAAAKKKLKWWHVY